MMIRPLAARHEGRLILVQKFFEELKRLVGEVMQRPAIHLQWALQGSNLRPSDYESAALTG